MYFSSRDDAKTVDGTDDVDSSLQIGGKTVKHEVPGTGADHPPLKIGHLVGAGDRIRGTHACDA